MIYFVRTMRFLKYDENFEQQSSKVFSHMRKQYPKIRDMKFLMNVTGPINEMHWVIQFDSLADEDEWAGKLMRDETYMSWMMASEGIIGSDVVDRLYREESMAG